MSQQIFFSWQSDTPSHLGRNFIREALEQACKELSSSVDVDEAVRNELEVDSDTQGEPGQPPVIETIFRKIDSAALFVADLTFTGTRSEGRPTPNPNVLIEYGWALKSLTHRRVISVMNEGSGEASRDALPFDLAHARWPTRFTLVGTETREEKTKIKRKLIAELKMALRTALTLVPQPESEPIPQFPRANAADGVARFRAPGDELGFSQDHNGVRKVMFPSGPAMWFRLMPSTPQQKTWTSSELEQIASGNNLYPYPFMSGNGWDWFKAEDGWGINTEKIPRDGAIETTGTAFVFNTGEIWTIDTSFLTLTQNKLYYGELLQRYEKVLETNIQFLKKLEIQAPYTWIAGLIGVKGRTLEYSAAPGKMWVRNEGPVCLTDQIIEEGEFSEGDSPRKALKPFFKKIFEKCGRDYPEYLNS